MRLLFVAFAAFALPLACGGGTPPPKDSDEVAPSPVAKSSTDVSDHPAAAASSAPAPEELTPPPAASSGPAKAPAADDVWMASHQMPPGDVLKTIRPRQAKVQACFRAGLKRDPSTSGEVKIRFVITNDGNVRDWRDDSSSMTDEEVTKCVGEVVKALKFPKQKSPGDAWGTYSINFTP
jgi:outer membrane biosynthesis protein TonB